MDKVDLESFSTENTSQKNESRKRVKSEINK